MIEELSIDRRRKLALIFEETGSILGQRVGNRIRSLRIVIRSKDYEYLEKIAIRSELSMGGLFTTYNGINGPTFGLKISNREDMKQFLDYIIPYLIKKKVYAQLFRDYLELPWGATAVKQILWRKIKALHQQGKQILPND